MALPSSPMTNSVSVSQFQLAPDASAALLGKLYVPASLYFVRSSAAPALAEEALLLAALDAALDETAEEAAEEATDEAVDELALLVAVEHSLMPPAILPPKV